MCPRLPVCGADRLPVAGERGTTESKGEKQKIVMQQLPLAAIGSGAQLQPWGHSDTHTLTHRHTDTHTEREKR